MTDFYATEMSSDSLSFSFLFSQLSEHSDVDMGSLNRTVSYFMKNFERLLLCV